MKVLDLFAGIGGFSLGLEQAGMETIAFCESDHFRQQVLRKHWPDVPIYPDIVKLCRRTYDCEPDLENDEWWCPRCNQEFGECGCVGTDEFLDTVGQPDIIAGGFPCQDISWNGAGAGLAGDRSALWYEMLRVVRELEPDFVVIENVTALLRRGLLAVLRGLAESGYDAEWHVIPASLLGGEHKRERVWVVAYAQSLGMEGLWPEGFQIAHALARPFLPLRDSDGLWQVEPDLRRVSDGVPDVSHRLRALGDAIVPQIAEVIGRAIMGRRKGKVVV